MMPSSKMRKTAIIILISSAVQGWIGFVSFWVSFLWWQDGELLLATTNGVLTLLCIWLVHHNIPAAGKWWSAATKARADEASDL